MEGVHLFAEQSIDSKMASEEGLTTPSSPVLDFLERKLTFEKTLNPSTISLNYRSRGGKNIPPPNHRIISNNVSRAKPHYDNDVIRPGKFSSSYRNHTSPKHRRTQSIEAFSFRTRSHSANSSSFSENSSPETPRSTPPSNIFLKPKDSSPVTPRHSLSSNSDIATKSESSSASDTPQNTHTSNISKRFEKTLCEAIPAANFFRPKEKAENCNIQSDIDSEKEVDATVTSPTNNQRWDQPDSTHLAPPAQPRSSCDPSAKGTRSYSDDRLSARVAKAHEDVPVFCVQDFNRCRVKDQRASPSRSRSVGSELKARRELIDESATHEDKRMGWRKNKSSGGSMEHQQAEIMSTGFKDKQKMIEAVINKGSIADAIRMDSKQISKESKKSSNVFRKMSFTSKLDKDFQNKIAKGDGSIKSVDGSKKSNRFFMNAESNSTTNGKIKFSKIIPKLNPMGFALRHSPPLSSDRNKHSEALSGDENSCDVADTNFKLCEESDTGVVIRNAKNRDIIKELQEKNFLETKPISHPPKQQTLTENDLVKLKAASETHKRKHSDSFPDKELIKLKPALNPKPKLNGIIASPIKSTSVHAVQKEVPDITPVINNQSQPLNEPVEPGSHGPPVRPPRRRNSAFPQKKNKAPLPPSPVAGSPVILEASPVNCPLSGVDSLCPVEESFTNTSLTNAPNEELSSCVTEKSSVSSVATFPLTADLPQGPPPRKPPRTFAHEIYASNKIRQLSNGNIETLATLPSSAGIEAVEAAKPHAVVSAPLPIYAVSQKKKHSNPGDNNGSSVCKPTIAPKPAHIKSLLSSSNSNHSSKRLSLIETSTLSLTAKDIEAVAANEQLKKDAHSRLSFRRSDRSPPDQPPPEPPSGPNPGPLSSPRFSSQDRGLGPPGGVGCGPTSLQCWSSDDFAYMTEGKLNRQKSQSDETLASYSGYHRLQGPAVEPIYATPQLGSSSRSRAASGGELHYMCSDLLAAGREDDVGSDTSSKKPASRTNLIAAWKQEFRQSCRLVQHRLKKTVNR